MTPLAALLAVGVVIAASGPGADGACFAAASDPEIRELVRGGVSLRWAVHPGDPAEGRTPSDVARATRAAFAFRRYWLDRIESLDARLRGEKPIQVVAVRDWAGLKSAPNASEEYPWVAEDGRAVCVPTELALQHRPPPPAHMRREHERQFATRTARRMAAVLTESTRSRLRVKDGPRTRPMWFYMGFPGFVCEAEYVVTDGIESFNFGRWTARRAEEVRRFWGSSSYSKQLAKYSDNIERAIERGVELPPLYPTPGEMVKTIDLRGIERAMLSGAPAGIQSLLRGELGTESLAMCSAVVACLASSKDPPIRSAYDRAVVLYLAGSVPDERNPQGKPLASFNDLVSGIEPLPLNWQLHVLLSGPARQR